jgi:AcrR family transcriptional regulator
MAYHLSRRGRQTWSGVVLSASLIIDTALRPIDERGAEALTGRRLGQALGADLSAIYRYFRSTGELLPALYDRLIGETIDGFVPGDDRVAALRGPVRGSTIPSTPSADGGVERLANDVAGE